jgi:hypothetical protein
MCIKLTSMVYFGLMVSSLQGRAVRDLFAAGKCWIGP